MSTQYECLKSPDLYAEAFGIAPPDALLGREVWPRQPGFFIRKALVAAEQVQDSTSESHVENPAEAASTSAPASPLVMELAQGQFGLVPTWVKSASDAKLRSTKLAVTRFETMSTATATRDLMEASADGRVIKSGEVRTAVYRAGER